MIKNIEISSRKLKKMEPLVLDRHVTSTEGQLYIYDHKDKWNHVVDLVKLYYRCDDEQFMASKLSAISQLIQYNDFLDMPELVLPKGLVTIDQNIEGFYMDYIENNINMATILRNKNVKLEKKLEHLKNIYILLNKLLSIPELKNKFYLADIHEGNFIFDKDDKIIKAVDLDSAFINKGYIASSKFLTFNKKLYNNPKYTFDYSDIPTPIPNRNTVILSYLYMVLNTLSGSSVYRWSKSEFYSYLSYLRTKGMKSEIVDVFEKIYNDSKWGKLSKNFLDEIDPSKDYSIVEAHIPRTENTGYYGDNYKQKIKGV